MIAEGTKHLHMYFHTSSLVPGLTPFAKTAAETQRLYDSIERYVESLRDSVLEGLKSGRSVADLKAELTLDDYDDWLNYEEWRALNIEGMARSLQQSGALD